MAAPTVVLAAGATLAVPEVLQASRKIHLDLAGLRALARSCADADGAEMAAVRVAARKAMGRLREAAGTPSRRRRVHIEKPSEAAGCHRGAMRRNAMDGRLAETRTAVPAGTTAAPAAKHVRRATASMPELSDIMALLSNFAHRAAIHDLRSI